ncbi:MAG: gamma-glutamyltransferase family protein [Gammaproteobacteria bacterium]|jgi:gamma-glutamyltranspeptidase / glutathione hydrolase|nr:gamma-glutamyltransferase family protein [Gammaproteobacteria bacterium]
MKKIAKNLQFIFVLFVLVSLFTACTNSQVTNTHVVQNTQVQPILRPPVAGPNAGISTGHPLTTSAAMEVLQNGGNAFDAGVAALLVGGVVEQDLYSLGGEALVLVYPIQEEKVTSITGQGWAAKAATIDYYEQQGKDLSGQGLDPTVVPGALHAALTVLERWGTMSFEEVAVRAIEYAENGFQLRPLTARSIQQNIEFINQWPGNQRYWLKPDGSQYAAGDMIRLPALANTLKRMVDAERESLANGRSSAIIAARDRFYKGDIAEEMVSFLQEHQSPFELSDFSEFYARIEDPVSTDYRGYTVYKQPFNSQGPMLLQTLNVLENFDLQEMGHNSADYTHTIIEAMKLSYADRDTYYADQDFVDVPAEGLLSKEYARQRADEINMSESAKEQQAGNPLEFDSTVNQWPYWIAGRTFEESRQISMTENEFPSSLKDTSHVAIIDKDGNIFDSTPSGGWIGGAVILGETGIGMSVRGEQFWLDDNRAAQLRPRSRPRYTLTPSIVLKDGLPFLAIGTPGGDNQEQTILQTFLNIVEFWPDWYPNLHAAIQWPRVQTLHFNASFWPHNTGFNRINVESNLSAEAIEELIARGHIVNQTDIFGISGCSTVVMLDQDTGNRIAAADPRRDCYAMAY